jgi:hypothetical protein
MSLEDRSVRRPVVHTEIWWGSEESVDQDGDRDASWNGAMIE